MRKTSLDALSRNGAGVPVVGHVPVESRWIEDPPFSVPSTVPASSGATMGVRPRQSQRSRGASIVATQADNDTDADDERLLSVPEDVVNALESDLAVEADRSAEEFTSAFDRPCKFPGQSDDDWCWWVVADAPSWCHNLLVLRSPFRTWLTETMQTRSLEQWSTILT